MEITYNLIIFVGAITAMLVIRQLIIRSGRNESDIDRIYRKILASDQYKVKGKFEE